MTDDDLRAALKLYERESDRALADSDVDAVWRINRARTAFLNLYPRARELAFQ